MRILTLSNLYPPHYVGGYELQCQTIVEALRRRGHQVDVLTSDHALDTQSKPLQESGVARALRIHGMFGHPWLGILQLRALEQHNNQALRSALEKTKPDLVYVWNCSGLSKSMLFTLQKTGLPTVFALCDHWIARSEKADVWLHWWNDPKPGLAHRLLRSIWTLSGQRRRCDRTAPTRPVHDLQFRRIHFCSRALRDFTAAAGFEVTHGAIIRCSVNTQLFKGTPRPPSQPLQRLLYVGRLTEDKGVMTALRAFALLRDKFAGSLSIYGRGDADYEARLKSFAEEQNLPVTFAGASKPAQMPVIYASHDALLFTSEWMEPFAIVPLEAMASGVPVIATTTGGSAELFRSGENSLTYSAGQPEDLARRILELEANPALRAQIAATGQREVGERVSEPVIVNQVEEYLRETLDTWPRDSRVPVTV